MSKIDPALFEELRGYVERHWELNREPVSYTAIWSFLAMRIATHRVDEIIALAVKEKLIEEIKGYIPKPKP